jgi:hypothetical protein
MSHFVSFVGDWHQRISDFFAPTDTQSPTNSIKSLFQVFQSLQIFFLFFEAFRKTYTPLRVIFEITLIGIMTLNVFMLMVMNAAVKLILLTLK